MTLDDFLNLITYLSKGFQTLPVWALQISLAALTLVIFYVSRRFFLNIVENRLRAFIKRFNSGETGDLIVDALMFPARVLLVAAALAIAQRFVNPSGRYR